MHSVARPVQSFLIQMWDYQWHTRTKSPSKLCHNLFCHLQRNCSNKPLATYGQWKQFKPKPNPNIMSKEHYFRAIGKPTFLQYEFEMRDFALSREELLKCYRATYEALYRGYLHGFTQPGVGTIL